MTEVYDLSDPAKPVKIRDFGLVGQQPGATGEAPVNLHGMISTGPQGNRIYFGYGTNTGGVLQIVDREKAAQRPERADAGEPDVSGSRAASTCHPMNGAHTAFPMLKMAIPEFANDKVGSIRDMVMIVDEQILNECTEPRQIVFFADITVEKRPMVVSSFSVPEKSGNFCSRGGRFGAHSSNESMAPVFNQKLAFITYFNAGVRAVDVRNPYQPHEVGYFIPSITEATDKRCIKVDGQEKLQGRDPEQQCGDRRPRLHLRRRSGQHRRSHSGSHRRGAVAIAGLPN